MFNMKLSAIIAAGALVLSFLVGLFSNVSILTVLLRAFIFCAVFFVFSAAAYISIKHFMPELFASSDQSIPGSHINILVEEPKDIAPTPFPAAAPDPAAAPPPVTQAPSSPAAAPPPVNKSADTGADKTGAHKKNATEEVSPVKKPAPSTLSNKLPDLEAMSKTVVPVQEDSSDTDDDNSEKKEEQSSQQSSSRDKALATDISKKYTPESLASALRTLLKQE